MNSIQISLIIILISITLLNISILVMNKRYRRDIDYLGSYTRSEIKKLQDDVHNCIEIITKHSNTIRQQQLEIERLKFQLRNKKSYETKDFDRKKNKNLQ